MKYFVYQRLGVEDIIFFIEKVLLHFNLFTIKQKRNLINVLEGFQVEKNKSNKRFMTSLSSLLNMMCPYAEIYPNIQILVSVLEAGNDRQSSIAPSDEIRIFINTIRKFLIFRASKGKTDIIIPFIKSKLGSVKPGPVSWGFFYFIRGLLSDGTIKFDEKTNEIVADPNVLKAFSAEASVYAKRFL